MMSPLMLVFSEWSASVVLHTDASEMSVGAVLTQTHEACEQVIAYPSHRWPHTCKCRTATESEFMAVVWSAGHFRSYVWVRNFNLGTHCSGLTWQFRSQGLSCKTQRWTLRLMEYNMTLLWTAGASPRLAFLACSRAFALNNLDASRPDRI